MIKTPEGGRVGISYSLFGFGLSSLLRERVPSPSGGDSGRLDEGPFRFLCRTGLRWKDCFRGTRSEDPNVPVGSDRRDFGCVNSGR